MLRPLESYDQRLISAVLSITPEPSVLRSVHDVFGNLCRRVVLPPGWGRAQASVKYAHERITFGYEHARATRTAFEAHEERLGSAATMLTWRSRSAAA